MKRNYILYFLVCLGGLFSSCNEKEDSLSGDENKELIFSSTIAELKSTKAGANNFFVTGDELRVEIQSSTSSTASPYTYVYGDDGIFRGNPPYHFPTDDSYIESLTAYWPNEAPVAGTFISDQRDAENHRKADQMVATASASGIMATNIPVPLHFEHLNCLLEFELVGQSSTTLHITELLIQLIIGGEPIACWAYCNNENGRASILLPAGTDLQSQEGVLIGTMPSQSGDRYSIILSEVNIDLVAGKKYLVTLTPRGYDLSAYVLIGSFFEITGETEAGIGVPLRLPQEGETGDYIISHPYELVTLAYLTRHYLDGSTIQWTELTYTITDDFEITDEYASLYIPIDGDDFTGQFIYKGVAVGSLPYGNNQTLDLFEND